MTPPDTLNLSCSIESLLTRQNHRGMDDIRQTLQPGYLLRAAQTLLDRPGNIFILTGFPVADTFETDGPAGALALYRLAQRLGSAPTIISDKALVSALRDTCDCHIISGNSKLDAQALYAVRSPQLVISIERPGASADGRYYNMAGEDISSACSAAEPYLARANCPTIAIGDGGNGDTTESMTRLHADLETLVSRGAVDGVTREPTATEDGFPLSDTTALISDIAQLLSKGSVA